MLEYAGCHFARAFRRIPPRSPYWFATSSIYYINVINRSERRGEDTKTRFQNAIRISHGIRLSTHCTILRPILKKKQTQWMWRVEPESRSKWIQIILNSVVCRSLRILWFLIRLLPNEHKMSSEIKQTGLSPSPFMYLWNLFYGITTNCRCVVVLPDWIVRCACSVDYTFKSHLNLSLYLQSPRFLRFSNWSTASCEARYKQHKAACSLISLCCVIERSISIVMDNICCYAFLTMS